MMFPNLIWAIRQERMAQFDLAAKAGLFESRLSRAINGRVELSTTERERIANILGYSVAWLFRPMTPSRAARGVA
jgi:transcriptional regulator with XRE-family HTH domain